MGENSLKHKILAVAEEGGCEKASYALKLLQSEGELTIASTGKNQQTGKMITQEYHVKGPVMIFLSTTAIDLDDELQNRCLTLAVDESSEQTKKIHQWQRERRTLAGLLAKTKRQEILKLMKNVQRLLPAIEVLNPHAPKLTFKATQTRNRRDHEKYLTLIDTIALLHQHQRTQKPFPPACGTKYIEVTLDDIALANELVSEILGRSLDELAPQARRLLAHIQEVLKPRLVSGSSKERVEMGEEKLPGGTATFTRKELRSHCGWSQTQIRIHLRRLVELEYLNILQGGFGSEFIYEALFDPTTTGTIDQVGLIDVDSIRNGDNALYPPWDPSIWCDLQKLAGQNGNLAVGGKTTPPAVSINDGNGFVTS